jgi:hypothetical protein
MLIPVDRSSQQWGRVLLSFLDFMQIGEIQVEGHEECLGHSVLGPAREPPWAEMDARYQSEGQVHPIVELNLLTVEQVGGGGWGRCLSLVSEEISTNK